jgi:hypothetical protein
MKKHFVTALVLLATTTAVFAQKKHKNPPPQTSPSDSAQLVNKALQSAALNSTEQPKPKKIWDLSKRSADHFMVELGYDNWIGTPDSINIQGFNHSVNFYFMFDFPFKTDARWSVGVGLGIGSSNIYFNQTYPQVDAYQNSTLAFTQTNGGTHYKSFKLVTTFLEVPVELRYALDPEHMDKSWKFAIGTKIGLMLQAHTKGKTEISNNGTTVGNITRKASSTQFFNTFKLEPTIRVSKGVFGIFAGLQANPLIKTSAGPAVYPFSAGIVLSGL